MKSHRWNDIVGVTLLLLCLGISVGSFRMGWEVPALSGHEFRQTQTALSIRAMQETGFKLDYETPVLGKPWSIPMEFPLYQYLVANYATWSGSDIPQAGRAVSAFAFLLGLGAFFGLARVAGYSVGASALLVAPISLAPIYLFYSRTVMIESLAWALAAWFLWGILEFRRSQRWGWLGLALVTGALAVLVKATTWAAFCLPWAMVYLHDIWCHRAGLRERSRTLLIEAAVGVGLLAVGWAWVNYADAVKARNPIGQFLISNRLTEFNFGTREMRFDGAFWATLWGYWTQAVFVWPVAAVGAGLALWHRRSRMILAMGVFGFLGIQLVFSGLYLWHDYYLYANAALLLVGLSAGLASCWDATGRVWMRGILVGLLGAALWLQYGSFNQHYRGTQTAPAVGIHGLAEVIQYLTDPADVVVAHSPDWNSTWPFYSERRMLIIPDSQMFSHPEHATEAIEALADESVGLLLMIGESRIHPAWLLDRVEDLGLSPIPLLEWNGLVTIYAPTDRYPEYLRRLKGQEFFRVVMDASTWLSPPADRIDLAEAKGFSAMRGMGIPATEGVLPFGIGIADSMGKPTMLMHALSELYFPVPQGATQVEYSFWISPNSLTLEGFDGMAIQLDYIDRAGNPVPLQFDWISPRSSAEIVTRVVDLPAGDYDTLVLRALPGPQGSNAFDQGLLHRFEFK